VDQGIGSGNYVAEMVSDKASLWRSAPWNVLRGQLIVGSIETGQAFNMAAPSKLAQCNTCFLLCLHRAGDIHSSDPAPISAKPKAPKPFSTTILQGKRYLSHVLFRWPPAHIHIPSNYAIVYYGGSVMKIVSSGESVNMSESE
jgi:hypothetical protein